jgi:hypothetical protein
MPSNLAQERQAWGIAMNMRRDGITDEDLLLRFVQTIAALAAYACASYV